MSSPGDQKIRFGRSYIFLNPDTSISTPEDSRIGTWRLAGDDVNPGPGPGPSPDPGTLQFKAEVKQAGGIAEGQLVYVDSDGARLAKADAYSTAQVAGVATSSAALGEEVFITRNETVDFYAVNSFVDNDTGFLEPGALYYLSAQTAGNWTRTPDVTTVGAVVAQVGTAVGPNLMAVEIQPPIVI